MKLNAFVIILLLVSFEFATAHETGTRGGGNETGILITKLTRDLVEDVLDLEFNLPLLDLDIPGSELRTKLVGRKISILVTNEVLRDRVNGVEQEVTAINFPDSVPQQIIVNETRFLRIGSQIEKKALLFHEMLSLDKLEGSGNYKISSQYLKAMNSVASDQLIEFHNRRAAYEGGKSLTKEEQFISLVGHDQNESICKIRKLSIEPIPYKWAPIHYDSLFYLEIELFDLNNSGNCPSKIGFVREPKTLEVLKRVLERTDQSVVIGLRTNNLGSYEMDGTSLDAQIRMFKPNAFFWIEDRRAGIAATGAYFNLKTLSVSLNPEGHILVGNR